MALHGLGIDDDDDGDNNINNKKYIAKLIMERFYLRALLSFLQNFLDSSLIKYFLQRAGPPECTAPCRRAQPSPRIASSPKRALAPASAVTDATGKYQVPMSCLLYLPSHEHDKIVADYRAAAYVSPRFNRIEQMSTYLVRNILL